MLTNLFIGGLALMSSALLVGISACITAFDYIVHMLKFRWFRVLEHFTQN